MVLYLFCRFWQNKTSYSKSEIHLKPYYLKHWSRSVKISEIEYVKSDKEYLEVSKHFKTILVYNENSKSFLCIVVNRVPLQLFSYRPNENLCINFWFKNALFKGAKFRTCKFRITSVSFEKSWDIYLNWNHWKFNLCFITGNYGHTFSDRGSNSTALKPVLC
jgi:hypothetical protein